MIIQSTEFEKTSSIESSQQSQSESRNSLLQN